MGHHSQGCYKPKLLPCNVPLWVPADWLWHQQPVPPFQLVEWLRGSSSQRQQVLVRQWLRPWQKHVLRALLQGGGVTVTLCALAGFHGLVVISDSTKCWPMNSQPFGVNWQVSCGWAAGG